MTRMPLAKADRKGVKRTNLGTELTSFGNFAILMDEENEDILDDLYIENNKTGESK